MQLDRLIERCNGRGCVVPTHADGHGAQAAMHNLSSAGASPPSRIAARTDYGTLRLWVTSVTEETPSHVFSILWARAHVPDH